MHLKNRERVIFALDVPKFDYDASKLIEKITPYIGCVKVGLELFIAEGPSVLKNFRVPIFLDLKLHDIPDTVERAIVTAASHNVKFLTVHIAQKETMVRAVKAAQDCGVTLLGVTVLTSMTDKDMREAACVNSAADHVNYLFSTAFDWGLRGFVCSGQEVGTLRSMTDVEDNTILVVPGVRSAGADAGSQKRIVTPKQAIDSGADYIVVGRQIRDAVDPVMEVQRILEEIG